jgi:4-diphosphocytidyl-2-C-methyl-D-erythritol kinase
VTPIRLAAPGKVNLRLRVLAREAAGFHQLETLFQALEFGDTVEITPRGSGIDLEVDGPSPCPTEENLAYRAAAAYLDRTGIRQGVAIRLEKRVPAGGGLGGGSSDAAAVLKAMNELYEGELGAPELSRIGRDLGSDVPFFLSPTSLALAWGRGDRLLPLPSLPSAPALLCLPDFQVSTREAFGALSSEDGGGLPFPPVGSLDPESLRSWAGVALVAVSDLEPVVFQMHPVLRSIRESLAGTSPAVAMLSGSGSTVFAIYEAATDRDRAQQMLQREWPGLRTIATRTLTDMPRPSPGSPSGTPR